VHSKISADAILVVVMLIEISKPKTQKYSQACDLWSFGCVLFYMFTGGRAPFRGRSAIEILDMIMTGHLNVQPLVERNVSLEGTVFIKKLLAVRPDLRPTERECLNDVWLYNGYTWPEIEAEEDTKTLGDQVDEGLDAIEEEEEEDYSQLSQLSLNDGQLPRKYYQPRADGDGADDREGNPDLPNARRIRRSVISDPLDIRDGREVISSSDVANSSEESDDYEMNNSLLPEEGMFHMTMPSQELGGAGVSAIGSSGVLPHGNQETQGALQRNKNASVSDCIALS
jgi:serine/threonine protein kinase